MTNLDDVKFLEIPFARLSVKKGDVIVICADRPIHRQIEHHIRRKVAAVFPDSEILIMESGLKIGVINKTDHIPGIDIDSYADLPTTNDDLPF